MGNVPLLHDDLVRQGLATEIQFAESMAVGQMSPGPNGLWVVCLGYILGGWGCAVAAIVAVTLPPLLVLVVRKLFERHRHHPAVEGFMVGLAVSGIAVYWLVMAGFLQTAPHTVLTAAIALVALAATLHGRIPTVAILLLAGLVGAALR